LRRATTTVKTAKTETGVRKAVARAREKGKRIGLVPTMGYLHEGHLALVRKARETCDYVVVSVFVNPAQFGPDEDLDRYPRDLRRDRRLLEKEGCDLVFAPRAGDVYPRGFMTTVGVKRLRDIMCGRVRKGHFDGVCVVVLKLLNMVCPDAAFFGEKDYQQLVVVRRMVRDLNLDVEIVGVPTVRDKDGLALSSRNAYLSPEERRRATALFRSLELGKLLIAGGERRAAVVRDRIASVLIDAGVDRIEYIAIVDPETLDDERHIRSDVRIAVAAWVGNTRLIDNIPVEVETRRRRGAAVRGRDVCIIMAAGEGKRMKSDLPKVLHTLDGKPMVAAVVRAARAAGVKDIIAVIGHGADRVRPILRRLRVETVVQDVQRGTGHAVLQAYPLLKDFTGDVLILSGDVPLIRPATLRGLMRDHKKHASAVTFATAVVPDASGYGRIVRGKDGEFERIVEEKDANARTRRIKEINGGIYCFKAEPLFDALLMLTSDNAQMEYYLPDTLDIIRSRGGRVEADIIEDFAEVQGVNTRKDLRAVRQVAAGRKRDENNKRGVANGVHRKGKR
jgi:pantoate--beta-alanine ligase